MKIVAYELNGKATYGVLQDARIIEVSQSFLARYPDVRSLLESRALPELAAVIKGSTATLKLQDMKLLPPVANPRKIFCVGLNYRTHVAETKRPDAKHPAIFVRFADSLTAHEQPMMGPASYSEMFDYEGELAVVIGKGGRHIAPDDAFDHIAGYACFNDGTVRDWQRHTHQWTPGKNFPATGAFGPALVTADEIEDVNKLTLTTRLNGEVMQHASLADLIFTIPVIIEYLSTFTELNPGDVIATGTPGGVGDRRTPPLYMQPGDIAEVEISQVGKLRNVVKSA
ncbi:2-keto-4-pentenoate hydratase/2-oxohepta-3-ene-1,7-dioic acid hydratase (catechol pathway) [Azotobacter beijerinckii]|uniref:2-keto-4-pentenoate hydratase/2-oxohepta-3-ene-1,7-dioic acid hydratase (Catechol pathway) n=1 Tax=Azotobacter beijerinckii TaxID=170623 RepID=A0A1H6XAL6_9GAMM|nr:fumarylacetoacetate hydrolase family protein [Azotobacter beijerinckii]SEJ24514.1 2-keto-4-pentenoate hydratase/2-oxohepta-3-ene-1,7-dioic acid hydratase (catechol pathway) [Azotobacter beijerinckii]